MTKTQLYFILILYFAVAEAQAQTLSRSTTLNVGSCERQSQDLPCQRAMNLLNQVMERITSASPQTFTGDLANNNICMNIKDNENRAWANEGNRSIRFGTELFLHLQNEDQLAWVISHELSHITMRHMHDGHPVTGERGDRLTNLMQQKVDADREYENARGSGANEQAAQQRLERIVSQINSELSSALGDRADSWMETEADDTALWYYLRAGYNQTEVAFRSEQVREAEAEGRDPHSPPSSRSSEERQAYVARQCQLSEGTPAPPIGNHRYASHCWSVWRLKWDLRSRNPELQTLWNQTPRPPANADALRLAQEQIREVQASGRTCDGSTPFQDRKQLAGEATPAQRDTPPPPPKNGVDALGGNQ